MRRKRKSPRQTELPIEDEKRLGGSPRWMLVFRKSTKTQPIVEIGTLEIVYDKFTRLREQFAEFHFAAIYTPQSRLHRSWGKQTPAI